MRRHARRDHVEPEIVQALECCGWSVDRISAPGFPDLVLGHRLWGIALAENKSARGRLTTEQLAWRQRWRGPEPELFRSVADVERFMARLKGMAG